MCPPISRFPAQYRAEHVVEPRLAEMEAAYVAKDFPTFARISMQDSNQFHATCLDTYPPIFYMNDTSKQIISLCHQLNAGPDGVIVRADISFTYSMTTVGSDTPFPAYHTPASRSPNPPDAVHAEHTPPYGFQLHTPCCALHVIIPRPANYAANQ